MKQRRRQLWPSPASASCARRAAAPAVPPRAERLGAKALSHGRANTQTPSRRHCAPSQTEHTQSVSRRHSRAGTHAHRRTHRCEGSAARRRRRRPSGMTMTPDLGTFLSCHYPPASPGSSGCRGRRARRRVCPARLQRLLQSLRSQRPALSEVLNEQAGSTSGSALPPWEASPASKPPPRLPRPLLPRPPGAREKGGERRDIKAKE